MTSPPSARLETEQFARRLGFEGHPAAGRTLGRTMIEIQSAWPTHPGYRIDLVPCRGTARVRAGDSVLAESRSALRLIETDHVERLYFPAADVRLDLLENSDHHSICPFKGQASYWSFTKGDPAVENVFWTYREPFEEVAGIEGYLGVYHEKVDVEIETTWPDGSGSVNRFPVWGDQSDLLAILEPRPDGDADLVVPGYHERTRDVVEGGQLLGQAIVAAGRTIPEQRVTFASATFIRAARFDDLALHVDPQRRGRTFSTIAVQTTQSDKLVASTLVLMDAGAPNTLAHTEPMPDVPEPAAAAHYDMRLVGRDLRIVDDAYRADPHVVGPPVVHAWIRFRDDPEEQLIRNALVAQATTHWTIAAALRPHRGFGEAQAHVSLSTAPVAMALAFHDDAPLDQWLLYTTTATWAGRGLAQGDGKVFTEQGTLVASYTLQAMIRAMLPTSAGRDAATAM
jgi:acyl-CoA thioesterase-2